MFNYKFCVIVFVVWKLVVLYFYHKSNEFLITNSVRSVMHSIIYSSLSTLLLSIRIQKYLNFCVLASSVPIERLSVLQGNNFDLRDTG